MDEITLKLDSPITEEQWDDITDVDFDCTDRIWFHTKHGKDVKFVKQKKGEWINEGIYGEGHSQCSIRCSHCDWHYIGYLGDYNYCPNCGASMSEGEEEE